MSEQVRNRSAVVQPYEGVSYWQPTPANGHADPKLTPSITQFAGASMGYQTLAVGGRVREHSHGDQVEFQVCFLGEGQIVIEGTTYLLVPGTACFLGYDTKHEIINTGSGDLVMLWLVAPAGLEDFFAAIGRPRRIGESVPPPFARPAEVVALERSFGMNDTK